VWERLNGPVGQARDDMNIAWLAMHVSAPYRKQGSELMLARFMPPYAFDAEQDEEGVDDGGFESDDQV
jgi:hypothetical protein